MFPLKPQQGQLAPVIASVVGDMIQDLIREDDNPLEDYLLMLETSPVLGAAADASNLMLLQRFGAYTHPDENIQTFIRTNIEQMNGSLNWSIAELSAADFIGYVCSEWSVVPNAGEWKLDRLQGLDPRKYGFRGTMSGITDLRYQGAAGDIYIPYDRIVHIVGRRWLSFGDPQGKASCKLAIAAWKAWKIVIAEMLVASQRQGTGLLVGKAPSDKMVPLFDQDGNPLLDENDRPLSKPAPEALLEALDNLDNRTVLATDIENSVEILSQQTREGFFLNILKYLQQLQLLAFLFPESILTTSGVGDSNLNSGQRTTLDLLLDNRAEQIKEAFLESWVRALIIYNFGEQEERYGSFPTPENNSVDSLALFAALDNAVSHGTFSSQDLDVINKMRELAGLPEAAAIAQQMSLPRKYWEMEMVGSNGNGR
jgi:hypothetical protein